MYYASFGILAVILHLIINNDVLRNGRNGDSSRPGYRYRQFLIALLVFYVADLLWGFLAESKVRVLAYGDTILFFATMALSVLLWTRYVIAFLNKKGVISTVFTAAGWFIFTSVMITLVVNFFTPIVFTFTEDMEYVPGTVRYLLLAAQLLLFILTSIYSLFVMFRSEGRDKVHYRAICLSGAIMSLFIILQSFDPFAPFYTIGCLLANCVIHVFVEEDEKQELKGITADARKEKERYNQIASSLAAEYEFIYFIDIETGNYMELSSSESFRALDLPQSGEDFYADSRKNARKFAHPDDRSFAESMYYKNTILNNLDGRRSYAYKYRIMVGDKARYYNFVVILSEDMKHFVVCSRDIDDTISAETARLEKEKASITFSQIAESLASNYDNIYYVNLKTGDFTGYTSQNLYGELEVDESGEDFFETARANGSRIIHPQDRDRFMTILDKDYLLTALEGRKQFNFEYRLIISDQVKHTRLSARKSSDGGHLIIGVENIDDEVKKEKDHIRALNTEKELARRDELTGIRNKTAFTELEQSIQDNIERGMNYLPFAIAVCDLNNLKRINDTEGHKAGDDYIRSSAKLLCEIFDHSPVFRIGGDEFAVFLSGDDFSSRKQLVEKLHRTALKNRDSHEGPVIAVGIADYDPSSDSNVSDIFERADHMMYEDKRELKSTAI